MAGFKPWIVCKNTAKYVVPWIRLGILVYLSADSRVQFLQLICLKGASIILQELPPRGIKLGWPYLLNNLDKQYMHIFQYLYLSMHFMQLIVLSLYFFLCSSLIFSSYAWCYNNVSYFLCSIDTWLINSYEIIIYVIWFIFKFYFAILYRKNLTL